MADFEEALEWMKQGKRVRISNWKQDSYIYISEKEKGAGSVYFLDNTGKPMLLSLNHIESGSWRIYEPKWNFLSTCKKRCEANTMGDYYEYYQFDIDDLKLLEEKMLKDLSNFILTDERGLSISQTDVITNIIKYRIGM